MAKAKLLAFLLCDKATADPDGKATLHGLFDRIIVPQTPVKPKLFCVYYKVVVDQPCAISLKVFDPHGDEVRGNWRDVIQQLGPIQSIWALHTGLFKQPGPYVLELKQETDDSEALSLASMLFVVEQQGE